MSATPTNSSSEAQEAMTHEKEAREQARQFRKKPVIIEAMQWDGMESGCQALKAAFPDLDTVAKSGHLVRPEVTHWRIITLEGAMTVSPGDWIIRGVKGELYPCKPDIFAATYDLASPPVQAREQAKPGITAYREDDLFCVTFRSTSLDEAKAARAALAPAEQAKPSEMPLPLALRVLAREIKEGDGLRNNSGLHHRVLERAADAIEFPAEQAKPSAGAYTFPSDKLVWRLIEARQSAHDLKETVELNAAMFGLAEDIMGATLPAEQQASVPLKLPEPMALDGHDKNHNGYHWRLGWNAALRSVLDYNTATPTPPQEPSQTGPW